MDIMLLFLITGILHFIDFYYTNRIINVYIKRGNRNAHNIELNKFLRYFMIKYGVNKGMIIAFPITLTLVLTGMYFMYVYAAMELLILGMLIMVAYTNLMTYIQMKR